MPSASYPSSGWSSPPAPSSPSRSRSGAKKPVSARLVFQLNHNTTAAPVVLTGPLFTVALPEVPRANMRLETSHFLPNVGQFDGLVDFANGEDSLTPRRGRLSFSEMRVGSWTASAAFGDVPYEPFTLDFGVAALYRSLTGLRGGSAGVSRGPAQLSVFSGRTTTANGFFGESVLVSDQSVFGGRAILRASPTLQLAIGLLHTSDGSATSAHTMQTGTTTSATLSTTYDPSPAVRVFGEVSTATLAARPAVGTAPTRDTSYLLGGRLRSERGRGELSVLRLGAGYAPLAFTHIGDRKGFFGSGDYRVYNRVWVSGIVNHWRNNVRRESARPVFNADNIQLGARAGLPGGLFAHTRIGQATAVTRRTDHPSLEQAVRTVSIDLSRRFGGWRLLGRGTAVQSETGGLAASEQKRFDLEVRRTWPHGSGAFATAGVLSERKNDTDGPGSGFAGSVGVDWPARRSLSVHMEASLNQELVVLNAPTVRKVAMTGLVNWRVSPTLTVAVRGRLSRDTGRLDALGFLVGSGDIDSLEAYLLDRALDGHQLNVRIEKNLRWGRRALLAGRDGQSIPARDFGHIAGMVFSDLDNDGTRDIGEQGVRYVSLKINGQTVAEVDEDGKFELRDIPVGRHTIELDLLSIPATYDVGSSWRVVVDVVRRQTALRQFPLVLLGKLKGRVLVNAKRSAIRDDSDDLRPAPNVLVSLTGGLKTTVTDPDGEFEFTSLPAGLYQVTIDRASLPQHWAVTSEMANPVRLRPGERILGLELRVEEASRPSRRVTIRQSVLKAESAPENRDPD